MGKPIQTIRVTGETSNQAGAIARHLLQRAMFTVLAPVRVKNTPIAEALQRMPLGSNIL